MTFNSNSSPISDIRVLSVQGRMEQLWRSAALLTVLNGELQIKIDQHTTLMNKNDIMLIPPCTPFTLSGGGSNLLLTVQIDYDFFSQVYSSQRIGQIVCNSAEDDSRDYSMLRQMLSYLALTYYENAEAKDLRLLEISYSILYVLSTGFFVRSENPESDAVDLSTRGRHIIAYVESNYMNEMQLDDLSQAVYLSPSYLSRLFKKLTGQNFKSYLEEVRLRHASEEMASTDKTITAIAYNNGFPNVSALSAAIRKKYDMSPSEYRTMLQSRQAEEPVVLPFKEVEYETVASELKSLAGSELPKAAGKFHYPIATEYTVDDVSHVTLIPPIWRSIINLGDANTLLDIQPKSQVEMVQHEIGFQYARIENVLTDGTIPMMNDGNYNFSKLFRLVNGLMGMHLTPFLDLSYPGDYLLQSRSQNLYRGDQPRGDNIETLYLDKVSSLIRRCINTFGSNAVEKWCIEICIPHNKDLQPLEKPEEYCRRFIAVYRMVKQWLPNMKIGGPEHHIAQNNNSLYRIMEILKEENVRPDFVSICAIPYEPAQFDENSMSHIISPNADYIRKSVQAIRDAVHIRFDPETPIYATVLGSDIRTRNYVNDSCYQSAFFAKNTVDLVGLVDAIGYWQLSDLCIEYTDSRSLLFGGTGIITRDGLKKSGFAALKRMARLNTMMIRKEDGMLLTTNGINAYNMLLYNYAHFNTLYCLSNGEDTTLENVYTVFNNPITKDVAVHLGGLKDGTYRIITTTINRENGSVFDEWLRYGTFDNLRPYDIRYLRDITHPHRSVDFIECSEGRIDMTIQLAPHEVKLIHIVLEM